MARSSSSRGRLLAGACWIAAALALLPATITSGAATSAAAAAPKPAAATPPIVQTVPLVGTVNPASAELVVSAIHEAEHDRRAAIIIEIDTPGGLDSSMREMVKAILASSIPVITYVS